jgi:CheY-like chemotaxis protein
MMTPGSKPAVLLVDDDPDDLFALRAALGGLEIEIACAQGGDDALRALLRRDFALVVMDLMMPRLNGFEVAALIRERERSRSLPIVILTGFDEDGAAGLPGYRAGEFDYLRKPVSPEALRQKVLESIARPA